MKATSERDRVFLRAAKISAQEFDNAPDITALWGVSDWQGYAEQLEDDRNISQRIESRRQLVGGVGGMLLVLVASVVVEFFAR